MRCSSGHLSLISTPHNTWTSRSCGNNNITRRSIHTSRRFSPKSLHYSSLHQTQKHTLQQSFSSSPLFSFSSPFRFQTSTYVVQTSKKKDDEEKQYRRQLASITIRNGIKAALENIEKYSNEKGSPSMQLFRTIVHYISKKEDAEEIVAEMKNKYNLDPDVHVLGPILGICAKKNDATGMEQWWKRISRNYGTSSTAYYYLLRACLRGNMIRRSRKAEAEARQKGLVDKQIKLVLIELCRLTGNLEEVLRIFEELLTTYPSDVEVFNTTISTLAFFAPLEAEKIAYDMESKGIQWTQLTYHSMMKVCALDQRDLSETLALFNKMQEHQIEPSVVTYTLLLEACKRERNYSQAQKILKDMMNKNIRPNNYMFTILVSLLSELRDRRVFDMINLMDDLNVKPNLQVYTSLLKAAYNLRDGERAQQLVEMMKRDDIKLDTMARNIMMRTLAHTNHFEDAWTEFMNMSKPDRISYAIFLNSFVHFRTDDPRAFDLIAMICDSDIEFTDSNFTSMLTLCHKWKRLDTANQILFTMKRKKVTPNEYTLSSYIAVCFACGEISTAIKYFEKTVEKYDIKPTTETLHTMLRVAVDKGAPDQAEKLIQLVEATKEKYPEVVSQDNINKARKLAKLQ